MLYRILEVEINMLKLSHIKKGYNKKDVLIDVDYTFQEGNITSLFGCVRVQDIQQRENIIFISVKTVRGNFAV